MAQALKLRSKASGERPNLRLWLNDDADAPATAKNGQHGGKILVDMDYLRKIIESSLRQNMFENAAEFAGNLVTLSGGNPPDVFLLARTYFLSKQYRRAVHVLEHYKLLQTGTTLKQVMERDDVDALHYIHLAAHAWIECGMPELAQSALECLLGDASNEYLQLSSRSFKTKSAKHNSNDTDMRDVSESPAVMPTVDSNLGSSGNVDVIAALCLLRGKVYEILENRARAVHWFKAALHCDVYCFEAFTALINNQLKPAEEMELIDELRSAGMFSSPETSWLEAVYMSRLSKHDHRVAATNNDRDLANTVAAGSNAMEPTAPSLALDISCISAQAERLYYQHDAQAAFRLTEHVRQADPFHLQSVTVHLATLVDLKRTSELFHLAHQLVDAYPKMAISWYAVGCYYFAINRLDSSRRYFHKATMLDPHMATAWLGFGHAFAAQDESDQAMAAYRTASRLCIGSHLPLLFTAIEYLRTNNVTLAEQFCRQSQAMCATDPLVLNELGVVFYRQRRFKAAIQCFKESLRLCDNRPASLMLAWEPAIFNLGHALRKLRKYDEAIQYYQQALGYNAKEASTYAALGLTHHLKGNLEAAIEHYHQALGLKPEDTFASEMLEKALTQSYGERSAVVATSARGETGNGTS